MDQRVDSERRIEPSPSISPASRGNAERQGNWQNTWRDALRQRRGMIVAIAAGVALLGLAIALWWLHASHYESTDDAFIDARTVQVSAQVSAAITDVPVTDNELVEAGAVLARLDDRDFVAQRDQAKAQVDQAEANINNVTAQLDAQQARIDQAKKQVVQAQASLTFAQQEADRYKELAAKGSGTVEQAQQYASNLLQNTASFDAAQANEIAAEKQNPVLETQRKLYQAQLAQAHAALQQAETNLSRTVITAPSSGRVTRLTAAKGNYAGVGQTLMMFVLREVWVTANFKETQLDLMRPGQPVDIEIDAYPDREFSGHVDSIQAGSGTAFSLLPAENATGNYVKIVQRVPVKIVFDKPLDVELGPGMSVVPTVTVR
jgi:membrane fusion protein, multidrug efflux system